MICRCSGRIEASTPQSVKDEMEIDVFDEIATLTGLTSAYMTDYKKALWLTYRYRMIANCDLEYWEQNFADALSMKLPIYDALMVKWAAMDPTDTAVSSYDLRITMSPNAGTDGDVTNYQSEDLPIDPVGQNEYLTNRNQTKYAPNHNDHHEYRAEDGLNATTFAQMMDDIESPLMRFVTEFERFFLNRWYRWQSEPSSSTDCRARCHRTNILSCPRIRTSARTWFILSRTASTRTTFYRPSDR